MVKLTIDGRPVEIEDGASILDTAKKCGVNIPTLCYLKDLNEVAACRVCMVEIEGNDKLSASCNTLATDGMVVHTNTARVRAARKTNTELLLSQHDCHCPTCVRSGNCSLQKLAGDLNITELHFEKNVPENKWNKSFPLIRDESKCIKCMRCVNVCDKIQSLGVWDINGTGSRATVAVSGGRRIENASCSLCGQCITHCPVGALRARDDTDKLLSAIDDKDKIVLVQIAPAVRAAWGEGIGLDRKLATVGRMVSAVRTLGADYVFDTDFSADLTIMEEASEFIERMQNKDKYSMPMFTSCCPGWVRFMKAEYPELTDNLSTAKSPQQMFGAVAKTYYAKLLNVEPEKIFSVSIMPCVAKKHEAALAPMNNDVDVVLTTRELDRMLRSRFIDVAALPEEEFDLPLGIGSGAGVIFGVTGGVMEAALRTAYNMLTGKNPDADAFRNIRGMNGWREETLDVNGLIIKIAVAHGLANARALIEALKRGEVSYDFIEIMACPGGCVGGGGQPIHDGMECADMRGDTLYALDRAANIRFSHENPAVITAYNDFFEKPLSHKSHELLHTDHRAWEMNK